LAIRIAFARELRRIRAEKPLPTPLRLMLLASQPLYLRRTLPSLTKLARTGLRELLGIAGPRSTSWHVEPKT
jgi:hypothetical protein